MEDVTKTIFGVVFMEHRLPRG